MKKFMKVGALAAVGCAVMTGCASRELTETQQIWLDDTEVLVEAKDPAMTASAKTGIAAIDAIADSITLLSAFSTGAITRYMYDQDAKSAWERYSGWVNGSDFDTKQSQAMGRYMTFPTMLKRTAEADTVEAKLDTLIAFDAAGEAEGEVGDQASALTKTQSLVDANYKPIVVERAKTVTVDGVTKTVYKTKHGGEAMLDDEALMLKAFAKAIVTPGFSGDTSSVVKFTYVGEAPAEVKDKDGEIIPDTLLIDELTNRPMVVRVQEEVDLAATLVRCYEGLLPLAKAALDETKTAEAREAAAKTRDKASEKAMDQYLAVMAVEQIDWAGSVTLLNEKLAQATADMSKLTAAIAANQAVIAGLAFGKSAAEGISAKESLEALERIQAQAALNVKLLPRLVKALTAQMTE